MKRQDKIKKIMNLLKNGLMIRVNGMDMVIIGKYIHWFNYGTSAVKTNLRELNWLIRVIGNTKGNNFEAYINESESHYNLSPVLSRVIWE